MKALIFAVPDAAVASALDVAGRPLLIRQLQWLRELGIEEVTIELAEGAAAEACAELVLGTDPLTAGCSVIPTSQAVGPAEVAARAGLASDELFLALPANVVAQGRFDLPIRPCQVLLAPPPFASERSAIALAFRTRAAISDEAAPRPGWAVHVDDALAAHSLSCAAIAGHAEGLVVHAAEVRPGIWFARGARVSEEATLLSPLLVGPNARVFGTARLGPNVIVGRGAVIEREAVLSEVSVAPNTLIGEDMRIRQAYVDACGYTSFADGTRTDVYDPMLVSTLAPRTSAPISRLLAGLLLLALLLPWALTGGLARLIGRRAVAVQKWRSQTLLTGTLGLSWLDLVPPLLDVLLGRRDLVGVSAAALDQDPQGTSGSRPGALDVSRALSADVDTPLPGMIAWYRANKSTSLDWQLLQQRARAPRELPTEGVRSGSF